MRVTWKRRGTRRAVAVAGLHRRRGGHGARRGASADGPAALPFPPGAVRGLVYRPPRRARGPPRAPTQAAGRTTTGTARGRSHTNFLERWLTALRSAGDHDPEATRHAGGLRARRGEDAVLHVRADAQAHAEADAVAHDGSHDRAHGDADAGADAEADDAHAHGYADNYADERPDGDPIICPDIYAHVGADWRADRCTQLHPHSDSHERAYGDAYCIAVLRTDGRAVAVAVEAADPGIAAHVRADAVALRDALGDAHGRAELRAHWRADVSAVGGAFVGAELRADVAAL